MVFVYIHQDIKTAWQLTQDRELVKKRSIDRNGFIETCKLINANLTKIFSTFHDNNKFAFWVFKKNGDSLNSTSEAFFYDSFEKGNIKADIENILNQNYNIEEL